MEYQKKILVFDDLERLSTNTLNEVLGFINTYTEHQNLKVIIIADETNIKEKIQDYKTVKEKLIRFTYLFNPELADVFADFVNRFSSPEYQAFLKANKQFICEQFEKGEHKNLRSLRFILDLFENIFLFVKSNAELKKENINQILHRLLFFFVTYSIEYKKDANDDNLNSLKDLSSDIANPRFGRDFINHVFGTANKEAEQKPEGIEKFKDDFETSYIGNDSAAFEFYDFLAEYIHTGGLDIEKLKQSCITTQEKLISLKVKPELIAFEKLKNCLTLSDDQFLPLIEEIYTYVDEGKYELENYPLIFQNILNCSLNGIANLQVDKSTVERFKIGMQKALTISHYLNSFRNIVSMFHQEENALLTEVREYASELNDGLQQNENEKLAKKVFETFMEGKVKEFIELITAQSAKSTPIFLVEIISPAIFLQQYLDFSNAQKIKINEGFQYMSNRFDHSKSIGAKELPFNEKLLTLVKEKIKQLESNKQLSTFNLIRFSYSLEEIIKSLQNN